MSALPPITDMSASKSMSALCHSGHSGDHHLDGVWLSNRAVEGLTVTGSRSRRRNPTSAESLNVEAPWRRRAGVFQGVTTIFPAYFGWIAQKYSTVPAVENVCENLSSVSRALEWNLPSFSVTKCGISSALTQVTVVPALTVKVGGSKVKLAIFDGRVVGQCPAAACDQAQSENCYKTCQGQQQNANPARSGRARGKRVLNAIWSCRLPPFLIEMKIRPRAACR